MHYKHLYRTDLSEILDSLLLVTESGNWNDAFPEVSGYKQFTPDDIGDEDEFPDAFRSPDHAIAHETIRYPELHDQMVEVVKAVTRKNNEAGKPFLASIIEHAGTHYATELALYDKRHVILYADFLFSNDMHYEYYQSHDFVRIVQKWGWCYETYYLLFTRWFAGGDNYQDDISYLNHHRSLRDCSIDAPEEVVIFLSALAAFLVKIGYNTNDGELTDWIEERFEALVKESVFYPCNLCFPENIEKTERLKKRFPEVLEMVKNVLAVERNNKESRQADVDIAEI